MTTQSMAFNPSSSLSALLEAPVRPGRLVWIGLRLERRGQIEVVSSAEPEAGFGLVGDRYSRQDGARQVTLVGTENLAAIGSFLGRDPIAPELVRRNLVVEGINLLALKGCTVRIGEAVLEITGECHPCSRMEQALGVGGYNAMRGQGGLTARVTTSGIVRLGDAVARVDPAHAPSSAPAL